MISAEGLNRSDWTETAKISTVAPDGTHKMYFFKVRESHPVAYGKENTDRFIQYATKPNGKTMIEGEYHSLMAIHDLIPTFAPKPYAWGKLKSSGWYFLLMDYIHLNQQDIDTEKLCEQLVKMHKASVSPTGKFGFHMTTCHGPAQNTEWESSWCVYFTSLLKQFF